MLRWDEVILEGVLMSSVAVSFTAAALLFEMHATRIYKNTKRTATINDCPPTNLTMQECPDTVTVQHSPLPGLLNVIFDQQRVFLNHRTSVWRYVN